jgi:hypothetical protein
LLRNVDDERDTRAALEERACLRPFSIFAKLVAVVRDEDDDGVVAQLEPFEFGDNSAQVPVRPMMRKSRVREVASFFSKAPRSMKARSKSM